MLSKRSYNRYMSSYRPRSAGRYYKYPSAKRQYVKASTPSTSIVPSSSVQNRLYRGLQNSARGRPELKYVDYVSSGTYHDAINTDGSAPIGLYDTDGGLVTTMAINGIAQGSAANQRIGRKVTVTSINMRALFAHDVQDGGNAPLFCRFVVYLDTQNNGINPGTSMEPLVTVDADIGGLTTTNYDKRPPLQYNDLNYSKRYKIIHSEFFTIIPGTEKTMHFMEKTHKFSQPIVTNYITNGITGAAIADNAIYAKVFVGLPTGVADANIPVTSVNLYGNLAFRVRFTDA